MFLVRRVCRTERVNAWKVAGLLSKICNAYEEHPLQKLQFVLNGLKKQLMQTECQMYLQL